MYRHVGDVEEEVIASLRWFCEEAPWRKAEAEYLTWHPDQGKLGDILGKELPEQTSFFLKIPPQGYVHIHKDNQKAYETYHIPLFTNMDSVCYVENEAFYLEVGKMYHVDRTKIHWSTNFGETDRIHLLLAL